MAIINFEFASKTLFQTARIEVFIPDNILQRGNMKDAAVMYLLHGKGDNEKSWGIESNAYKYAKQYGVIMIMPFAANSFYTNMAYGDRYWGFIAEELPKVLENSLKISSSKEKTFVCGYSMGGYGALKLGLTYPERYSAVGTLSGSLRSMKENKSKIVSGERPDLFLVFGDCGEKVKEENDIYYLTSKALKEGKNIPKLYIYCGKNDSLYDVNIRYKNFAIDNHIDLIFKDDDGNHSFEYWDEQLNIFLEVISNLK